MSELQGYPDWLRQNRYVGPAFYASNAAINAQFLSGWLPVAGWEATQIHLIGGGAGNVITFSWNTAANGTGVSCGDKEWHVGPFDQVDDVVVNQGPFLSIQIWASAYPSAVMAFIAPRQGVDVRSMGPPSGEYIRAVVGVNAGATVDTYAPYSGPGAAHLHVRSLVAAWTVSVHVYDAVIGALLELDAPPAFAAVGSYNADLALPSRTAIVRINNGTAGAGNFQVSLTRLLR